MTHVQPNDDHAGSPKRVPRRLVVILLALAFAGAITTLAVVGGRSRAASGADQSPGGAAPRADEQRLVVLSPGLAIALVDLGLQARIVGRHGYDMVLPTTIPVCGDQAGIDYEALLAARPTHVILEWGRRDLPERLMQLAAEHSWIVLNYRMDTLQDISTAVVELYDTLVRTPTELDGPRRRGVELPTHPALLDEMDRAFSPRGTRIPRAGRILMLAALNPPAALGPGSYHAQILEAIGGSPAISSGNPYIELDAEDVLRLAPDGIVLFAPREVGTAQVDRSAADLKRALGVIGTLAIPAVEHGHIAVIDDPLCLIPSPRLKTVADELAAILAGWSAGDPHDATATPRGLEADRYDAGP